MPVKRFNFTGLNDNAPVDSFDRCTKEGSLIEQIICTYSADKINDAVNVIVIDKTETSSLAGIQVKRSLTHTDVAILVSDTTNAQDDLIHLSKFKYRDHVHVVYCEVGENKTAQILKKYNRDGDDVVYKFN
jgi:hypothetical protein